jgi:hypothetical protein
MGYDFKNHHVFAGDADAAAIRNAVIDKLADLLGSRSPDESDARRSLVIGPPDRWIFVGDSASMTEDGDPAAFAELGRAMSTIAPVVDVKMSDSAIVHIELFRGGALVDRFGNGTFPVYLFRSEEEAEPFRGTPEKWTPYLTSAASVDALRQAWSQDGIADEILTATVRLLGMNEHLAAIGYSIFDESDEIKYDKWLENEPTVDRKAFLEMHFA